MNILCIANEVGISAAGIVYDTIINELCQTNNVYIICPNISATCMSYKSATILPTSALSKDLRWSVKMISAQLFGLNIIDYLGVKKHIRKIGSHSLPHIDCILSLVSQQKYFGLLLGRYLSTQLKTKWAVYSVDAIPAPFPWNRNYLMRKRVERKFCKLVKKCDLFASANPQMLAYQLDKMRNFKGVTEVIYTPSQSIDTAVSSLQTPEQVIFLYTGSIYGLRRVDELLLAYRKLVREYDKTKIIFVGHHQHNSFANCQDLIDEGKLELHPATRDISRFYGDASILLDISADISNDVFLSSKMATYLPFRKPIICISGDNSPVSNIFTKDKTIIHCKHSGNAIYDAMLQAMSMIGQDTPNRDYYIRMFSVQENCKQLINAINLVNIN